MKEKFMDAVADNMALISNHMDGEADRLIAREVESLMGDLDKIMEKFAILKATLDEAEEEYSKDFYEEMCNDDIYGEDFEEWWETLEKLEDILD